MDVDTGWLFLHLGDGAEQLPLLQVFVFSVFIHGRQFVGACRESGGLFAWICASTGRGWSISKAYPAVIFKKSVVVV